MWWGQLAGVAVIVAVIWLYHVDEPLHEVVSWRCKSRRRAFFRFTRVCCEVSYCSVSCVYVCVSFYFARVLYTRVLCRDERCDVYSKFFSFVALYFLFFPSS